ncbi:hypothetical protein L6452_10837 [Arctium lappa]|uniref:Uncharacterized protein n=1 Tax=Arctium lappa TaxID=4217 RepID=A0ACB9DN05_ARCLA|nr:hypothetical protein L6452_10837 [Arctium lappa]
MDQKWSIKLLSKVFNRKFRKRGYDYPRVGTSQKAFGKWSQLTLDPLLLLHKSQPTGVGPVFCQLPPPNLTRSTNSGFRFGFHILPSNLNLTTTLLTSFLVISVGIS